MTDRILSRQALPRPSTVDEAARTVELVVATSADVGDGVILSMDALPAAGPYTPVLLGHQNTPERMAGRIENLRLETGQLIGLARFADAPASETGWAMARSGCAVSVGASFSPDDLVPMPGGRADLARRWKLRECSLVPVGADPAAITRSAPDHNPVQPSRHTTMNSDTQTIEAIEPQDTPIERAAERVELQIRRSAAEAKLDAPIVDRIVAEHRYAKNATPGLTAVVREVRERIEANAPVHAGHPARVAESPVSELEETIKRCLNGQSPARPLVEVLRAAGYSGRRPSDVVRAAFTGSRPENWLARGFHTTSDAKDLLLATGDRRLQEQFSEPPRGIMEIARLRELADFREASVLDVGLVGAAEKILEGGEITFKSLNDNAGKYSPSRYGMGLAVSFEALTNDDLGGLDQVLREASATMLEAEADSLANLLTVDGDGADAPDGVALFDSTHENSIPADMTIGGLSLAVQALRAQTSIGGRRLWLSPGFVMVGPALETQALQLLTETWQPAEPENANPWRLRLIVEPSIEDETFYLIAAGPRQPFELGRISGLPRLTQAEDFDTSALKFKVEHGFGVAVCDHRVIVRCTEPQT